MVHLATYFACIVLAVVAEGGKCPEVAALTAACKPQNGVIPQCILTQGGKCKAAINAIVAKKNVAICKEDAEHTEHVLEDCKSYLNACPALKGLGECFKSSTSTLAKTCAALVGESCYTGIHVLLAKKTRSKAGCMKIAQMFDNTMKRCRIGQCPELWVY